MFEVGVSKIGNEIVGWEWGKIYCVYIYNTYIIHVFDFFCHEKMAFQSWILYSNALQFSSMRWLPRMDGHFTGEETSGNKLCPSVTNVVIRYNKCKKFSKVF